MITEPMSKELGFPDNIMRVVGFEREADTIHLFVGPGPGVGKSYLARKFASENGLKRGSTSDVVIERLAKELAHTDAIDANPRYVSESIEANIRLAISRNKESFRWLLIAVGDQMCREDPSCLAQALVERGCRVVDGIRRISEMNRIVTKYPDHKIWWVERYGYPKKNDNTDLTLDYVQYVARDFEIIKNEEES